MDLRRSVAAAVLVTMAPVAAWALPPLPHARPDTVHVLVANDHANRSFHEVHAVDTSRLRTLETIRVRTAPWRRATVVQVDRAELRADGQRHLQVMVPHTSRLTQRLNGGRAQITFVGHDPLIQPVVVGRMTVPATRRGR